MGAGGQPRVERLSHLLTQMVLTPIRRYNQPPPKVVHINERRIDEIANRCSNRIMIAAPKREEQEIKVFISNRDSKCDECKEHLGWQAWITLEEEKGALGLACADLDQLEFLPSGDAALTRRAKRHSKLSAVVLKFSRARGRYERKGLLVEEDALIQAEAECLADQEVRARRAERESERRAELDREYLSAFATRVREV